MEEVDGGGGGHDVVALVAAAQVERGLEDAAVALAAQAEEAASLAGALRLARESLLGADEFRFVLGGCGFEHLVVGLVRLAQQHGDAFLYDARLLRGDLLQRVAQQRRVFESDVGHDAQDGHDDVRGVEPSAEPRLDHGDLHVALREVVESQRCGHLEERELRGDHCVVVLVHEIDHLLLGDHLAIDADAFAEVLQVGRGEQSGAVSGLLQHGGDHVRHGALAVGARHVDGEEVALRVADAAAECGDAVEARFVGREPFGFVGRKRREEEFERLGVVHIGVGIRVRGSSSSARGRRCSRGCRAASRVGRCGRSSRRSACRRSVRY